jgi:hypothetical protein
MKFCTVVPEICRGQVHASWKERIKRSNSAFSKFSGYLPKHGIKMGGKNSTLSNIIKI